jgi:hypothetical protein
VSGPADRSDASPSAHRGPGAARPASGVTVRDILVRCEILLGTGFWIVAIVVAGVRGTLGHLLYPHLLWFAAAIGGTLLLRRTRIGRGLSDWLPLLLVLLTYDMLHAVAPRSWDHRIDPWLRDADRLLLGGRDAAPLFDGIATPAVTFVLAACYASYYVLPTIAGVLWWRRDRAAFETLLGGTVRTLFVGYLGYLLLPAVGPQAFDPAYAAAPFREGDWIGPLIRLRNGLHGGNAPTDAFPSLHTANAVTLLLTAWTHDRRTFRIVVLPMAGLIVATVVLRYHYVTDLFAGTALAIALQPRRRA